MFCFVLGNNIFLKVALLWSGNLKYPNACFPRWSQLEELPPSLDVPGLNWLESSSGLSCMYRAPCLEAREPGAAWARAAPEISLLLHRLELTSRVHCCHCRVLALLTVASRQALPCRDTLHPTLGTPRPRLLQTVGDEHWPGSGTHLCSARPSPHLGGGGKANT